MFTYEVAVPFLMKPSRYIPAFQGATPAGYTYLVELMDLLLIKGSSQR